jgi:hypothetical protein
MFTQKMCVNLRRRCCGVVYVSQRHFSSSVYSIYDKRLHSLVCAAQVQSHSPHYLYVGSVWYFSSDFSVFLEHLQCLILL